MMTNINEVHKLKNSGVQSNIIQDVAKTSQCTRTMKKGVNDDYRISFKCDLSDSNFQSKLDSLQTR